MNKSNGTNADSSATHRLGKVGWAVATGVVGFFLGIAGSQANDIGQRADACNDALDTYLSGVQNVRMKLPILSDPRITPDQWNTITTEIGDKFSSAHDKVLNVCPMNNHGFLAWNHVQAWTANTQTIASKCLVDRKCDAKEADALAAEARDKTIALLNDGNKIDTWGVFQRGWYVLKHLW